MPTNNITRLLESRDIPYKAFELPQDKLSAQETADILQVPLSLIYKSIVAERKSGGKWILAVVPGDREVDTRALAKAAGEKKVTIASQKTAERETGLKVGGISPLALVNRGFDIFIDSSSLDHDQIHVSGGEPGINIRLPVKALLELTGAGVAIISRPT